MRVKIDMLVFDMLVKAEIVGSSFKVQDKWFERIEASFTC